MSGAHVVGSMFRGRRFIVSLNFCILVKFLCSLQFLSLCLLFIKYIFLFYLILLYPCDSYRPVCRGRSQVGRAASRPRRSATGSVPTRPRLGAAARCLTDRRGSVAAAAATRVAAGWTAEAFLLSGNVKCISATYILAVNLLHYQFFVLSSIYSAMYIFSCLC